MQNELVNALPITSINYSHPLLLFKRQLSTSALRSLWNRNHTSILYLQIPPSFICKNLWSDGRVLMRPDGRNKIYWCNTNVQEESWIIYSYFLYVINYAVTFSKEVCISPNIQPFFPAFFTVYWATCSSPINQQLALPVFLAILKSADSPFRVSLTPINNNEKHRGASSPPQYCHGACFAYCINITWLDFRGKFVSLALPPTALLHLMLFSSFHSKLFKKIHSTSCLISRCSCPHDLPIYF